MNADSAVTVGILPPGALGAAFFAHLTDGLNRAHTGRVRFMPRAGATGSSGLKNAETLRIASAGAPEPTPLATTAITLPSLGECATAGRLPEIILVCPQTDKLLPILAEYVAALETLYARGGADALITEAPILVLCSNGIFHQRVRRFLVEALEESALYGRLPDLWAGETMGKLVGKLLRGVTIQTGRREGDGADAIYRAGPRGRTRLCGGAPEARRHAAETLAALGAWVESESVSPTRVEFDKALVNLCGNLLGMLKSIDDTGAFTPLKVKEIFPTDDSPETRELIGHVIAIGRAVRAYAETEAFETLYRAAMTAARGPLEHTPSSIAWLAQNLREGTLSPHVPPTEAWLLDPLIAYARTAGLTDSEAYLRGLVARIESRLALASAAARR